MSRRIRSGAIIVLDGADASGKSTLAKAIMSEVVDDGGDFLYLHGLPWPGKVWGEHMRMLDQARDAARREEVVVIDHYWIAEQLYGAEYRGGPAYDPTFIDQQLQSLGAISVLCVPCDLEAQAHRHKERRRLGLEEFEHARGIIRRYYDLAHGNVAHPGDGYLDKYVRHQDWAARKDAFVYEMDRTAMAKVPAAARAYLADARASHRFRADALEEIKAKRRGGKVA